MKALAPEEPRKLPSNFPYLTMRRIKEEQRLEERRLHVIAIVTTIAVSLAGIVAILFFIGDALWHSLVSVCSQSEAFALVLPTLFCYSLLWRTTGYPAVCMERTALSEPPPPSDDTCRG